MRVLAADPDRPATVLLGTATGSIFRSSDAGRGWSFFSHVGRHDDWVISSLIPDPGRPGRWYASLWSWTARNGGVFTSADSGRHWHALWLGHAVRALALAPSNSSILVAAALDGVYRSQDAGRDWSRISPVHDRELENVESVAIAPHNPQEIYVGTWHLPWKTINGGHDWWQMRQGVIDDSDVFSIAVDRLDPQILYLSACSGIYRSEDRGDHFQKIQGIPYSARRTPAIVQDPLDPKTIYAGTTQGLWVTHDQGATWERITSPRLSINTVLPLPRRLLLGTNFAGVFVSTDSGRSFHRSDHGFSSRHVAAVAYGPGGRYISVTGDQAWGGIFLQRGDASWQHLPLLPARQQALALHWSSAGLLAATAQGIYLLPPQRGDHPQRWEQLPGMPTSPLYALAGTREDSLEVWAAGQLGLFRSRDGGRRWSQLRQAPAPLYHLLLAADGAHAPWLWIAGDGYVLRSHDGGEHFLPGRLTLDAPGHRARIHQLALASAPDGTPVLLAATTAGLYTSRDRGAHWSLSGHGLPALDVRSMQAHNGVIVAFARAVGATFRSRDGGQHWQPVRLPAAAEAEARLAPMLPMPSPTGEAGSGAVAGSSNPER